MPLDVPGQRQSVALVADLTVRALSRQLKVQLPAKRLQSSVNGEQYVSGSGWQCKRATLATTWPE